MLLCSSAMACTNHPAPKTAARLNDVPAARGGGPLSLVSAVDAIATERCAHEGACGRIGPGRRFFLMDDCQKEFVTSARKQLNMDVCETGLVEPEELTGCLKAIRKLGCTRDVELTCSGPRMCSP